MWSINDSVPGNPLHPDPTLTQRTRGMETPWKEMFLATLRKTYFFFFREWVDAMWTQVFKQ